MDRDGYISNGELYLVLKQMVGNNLKVSCILSHGVEAYARINNCSRLSTKRSWKRTRMGESAPQEQPVELTCRDGKLSFEEFTDMVASTDIVK